MTNMIYRYLHLVNYKDIPNWSVQYADEEELGFTNKYPMAKIGAFLTRRKEAVDIRDGVIYKRVTVSTKGGNITIRDEKDGKVIGTKKQFIIHEGQFLLSKIDARNGAYGVVPAIADGAIITGNFWTYDVDYERINPLFLTLVTKTQQFLDFAEKSSNGTTNRHYLQEDAFLNQQIPLPSIEEQEKMLEMYNAKVKEADLLFHKSEDILNSRNAYLKNVLKFYYHKNERKGSLKFLHFTDLSRWDVLYYSSQSKVESFYITTTLGNCLELYMIDYDYQSLRTETYKTPEKQFHYIGMEHVQKNTGVLNSFHLVKGETIKSQTIRIPKGFLIYGKLRPYLNKYWENNEDFDDIVCSSEFLCFLPKKGLNKTFFKFILSSYIIQDQIADSMTGARMPRIDDEIFKNIIIPIPPRNIQDAIATYLTEKEKEAFQLKDKSKSLQESAYNLFITEIFAKL